MRFPACLERAVCERGAAKTRTNPRSTEVDLGLEIRPRVGVRKGFFHADRALAVKVEQGLVEALHARLSRVLEGFLHVADVALEYQLRDVRRVEHNLDRRDSFA